MRRPTMSDRVREAETIVDAFELYRAEVIPDHVGPNQVLNEQRAFYAAALWLAMRVDDAEWKGVDVFEILSGVAQEANRLRTEGGGR